MIIHRPPHTAVAAIRRSTLENTSNSARTTSALSASGIRGSNICPTTVIDLVPSVSCSTATSGCTVSLSDPSTGTRCQPCRASTNALPRTNWWQNRSLLKHPRRSCSISSIEEDSLGAPAHNSPVTDYRCVLAGPDFLKSQALHRWCPGRSAPPPIPRQHPGGPPAPGVPHSAACLVRYLSAPSEQPVG